MMYGCLNFGIVPTYMDIKNKVKPYKTFIRTFEVIPNDDLIDQEKEIIISEEGENHEIITISSILNKMKARNLIINELSKLIREDDMTLSEIENQTGLKIL